MTRFAFGGVDLTPFLTFLKAERSIGNGRQISFDSSPRIGANVQKVAFEPKTIRVHVSLASRPVGYDFVDTLEVAALEASNLNRLREELAGVLHTEIPLRLELPDEADRYYLAIPKGDIELAGISDWYDQTVIEFVVPDGVAHSSTYKRVETVSSETGKMVFELENKGTVPAYPIITVDHRSGNSLLGLANQDFVFEVGGPLIPVVATQTEQSTTTLQTTKQNFLDFREGKLREASDRGKKNVAVGLNDVRLSRILTTVATANRLSLDASDGWSAAVDGKFGASLTWDLPQGASGAVKNVVDTLWWKQSLTIDSPDERGYMQLYVTDTNGHFLYGVETDKTVAGIGCTYRLSVADGKGGRKTVKIWTYFGSDQTSLNPFSHGKGQSEIQRDDDKIQIHWAGTSPVFIVPELKGKVSAKLHVLFGTYARYVQSRIYLEGLLFHQTVTSEVVQRQQEQVAPPLPASRFLPGSKVVINSETDMVYVDDLPKNSEIAHGSKWPIIPPGTSRLEVYVSEYVQEWPIVTIDFEERWL